jgi:multisubunit Na+/H+ antiporter MnhC subunit
MTGMEAILKVISFFIALFMVANGVYVMYMPPYGDEMQGIAIIMMGIFIFIAVIWISRLQEQSCNT